MLKKMNEKKNNKGFSLVELIVVILIMAVLAVAIAPQVMKWVKNARIASDATNVDSIVSAIQLYQTTDSADKDFTIEGGKDTAWDPKNAEDTVNNYLIKTLGSDWKTKLQLKETPATYKITVSGGMVSAPAISIADSDR